MLDLKATFDHEPLASKIDSKSHLWRKITNLELVGEVSEDPRPGERVELLVLPIQVLQLPLRELVSWRRRFVSLSLIAVHAVFLIRDSLI